MIQPPLTVIIPAYNEAATIDRILCAVVAAPFPKQIVVVDDGSTDETAAEIARSVARLGATGPTHVIESVRHGHNRGKGAAIRSGLELARCRVTIVQDADLEYFPDDYPALVDPILSGKAEAVYGSRYMQQSALTPFTANRLCVTLLNVMVRLLYGYRITDEATCYKALRTEDLRNMHLVCERFEFCPEVTAKACRMRLKLLEVPIRYHPRTHSEGKKIGWRDGLEAITTLCRWRLAPFAPIQAAGRPLADEADVAVSG